MSSPHHQPRYEDPHPYPEVVDHSAMTQAGPTQLGPQIGESWAYSQATDIIDYRPASNMRTALIAGGILAAAAVVVGALLLIDRTHREAPASIVATPSAPTTTMAAPMPPPPSPQLPAPTPAPAPSQVPAYVALSGHGGSVFVKTQSGKTVCQVTAGDVACNVAFTRPVPAVGGLPASGIKVTARGGWEWLNGDPGDPDYNTLNYGSTYRALGWTITPSSDGTTFVNESTGHGTTVSTEGFSTF